MTDPLSIADVTSSLVFACTDAVLKLSNLIEKYKHAETTIMSLSSECSAYSASIAKIHHHAQRNPQSFKSCMGSNPLIDNALEASLNSSQRTLEALNQEIGKLNTEYAVLNTALRTGRARAVWNEALMKTLLDQLRGQQLAVSGMINLLQLDALNDVRGMTKSQNRLFRRIFSKGSKNIKNSSIRSEATKRNYAWSMTGLIPIRHHKQPAVSITPVLPPLAIPTSGKLPDTHPLLPAVIDGSTTALDINLPKSHPKGTEHSSLGSDMNDLFSPSVLIVNTEPKQTLYQCTRFESKTLYGCERPSSAELDVFFQRRRGYWQYFNLERGPPTVRTFFQRYDTKLGVEPFSALEEKFCDWLLNPTNHPRSARGLFGEPLPLGPDPNLDPNLRRKLTAIALRNTILWDLWSPGEGCPAGIGLPNNLTWFQHSADGLQFGIVTTGHDETSIDEPTMRWLKEYQRISRWTLLGDGQDTRWVFVHLMENYTGYKSSSARHNLATYLAFHAKRGIDNPAIALPRYASAYSPLCFFANQHGNDKYIRGLLSLGANAVGVFNEIGYPLCLTSCHSPLKYAMSVYQGEMANEDSALMMIEGIADIDAEIPLPVDLWEARDNPGIAVKKSHTTLTHMVMEWSTSENLDIAKCLLKRKPNVRVPDSNGVSVLEMVSAPGWSADHGEPKMRAELAKLVKDMAS